MLVKELLQQSSVSPHLMFLDPFRNCDRESLVRTIIGLANVDVHGPRYLVFGVNLGAVEGSRIVGIADGMLTELKCAHRLISSLIKPVLHLAFIFDKIDGKLVGALEIDGCDAAPYVVAKDCSNGLAEGQSWVRDGLEIRSAEPADLERIRTRVEQQRAWKVSVGLGDRHDCQLLEMQTPDTSSPPSAEAERQVRQSLSWKESVKEALGTINTHVLRLLHVRQHGVDAAFDPRGTGTLRQYQASIGDEYTEADDYYFFEEQALKLNLTVCNQEKEGLEDLRMELALPTGDGFEVVDRLYADPGKRTSLEIELLDYPKVERHARHAVARASLGYLAPNESRTVFDCALRMAVGGGMRGRKVALRYTLRARNKAGASRGRLKIRFT